MLDSIEVTEPNPDTVYPSFPKNNCDIFSKAKLQVKNREREKERRIGNKLNSELIKQRVNSNINIIEEVNELNEELNCSLASTNDRSFLINENQSSVENWINVSKALMEISISRIKSKIILMNMPEDFTRNQKKTKSLKENHSLTLTAIQLRHHKSLFN